MITKSLFEQVHVVEAEAQEIVARARTTGSEAVAQLRSGEELVMKDVQEQALLRGQAIKEEKITVAKQELNLLHQEEVRSLEAVHQVAQVNREETVAFVLNLLAEEFTNKK